MAGRVRPGDSRSAAPAPARSTCESSAAVSLRYPYQAFPALESDRGSPGQRRKALPPLRNRVWSKAIPERFRRSWGSSAAVPRAITALTRALLHHRLTRHQFLAVLTLQAFAEPGAAVR